MRITQKCPLFLLLFLCAPLISLVVMETEAWSVGREEDGEDWDGNSNLVENAVSKEVLGGAPKSNGENSKVDGGSTSSSVDSSLDVTAKPKKKRKKKKKKKYVYPVDFGSMEEVVVIEEVKHISGSYQMTAREKASLLNLKKSIQDAKPSNGSKPSQKENDAFKELHDIVAQDNKAENPFEEPSTQEVEYFHNFRDIVIIEMTVSIREGKTPPEFTDREKGAYAVLQHTIKEIHPSKEKKAEVTDKKPEEIKKPEEAVPTTATATATATEKPDDEKDGAKKKKKKKRKRKKKKPENIEDSSKPPEEKATAASVLKTELAAEIKDTSLTAPGDGASTDKPTPSDDEEGRKPRKKKKKKRRKKKKKGDVTTGKPDDAMTISTTTTTTTTTTTEKPIPKKKKVNPKKYEGRSIAVAKETLKPLKPVADVTKATVTDVEDEDDWDFIDQSLQESGMFEFMGDEDLSDEILSKFNQPKETEKDDTSQTTQQAETPKPTEETETEKPKEEDTTTTEKPTEATTTTSAPPEVTTDSSLGNQDQDQPTPKKKKKKKKKKKRRRKKPKTQPEINFVSEVSTTTPPSEEQKTTDKPEKPNDENDEDKIRAASEQSEKKSPKDGDSYKNGAYKIVEKYVTSGDNDLIRAKKKGPRWWTKKRPRGGSSSSSSSSSSSFKDKYGDQNGGKDIDYDDYDVEIRGRSDGARWWSRQSKTVQISSWQDGGGKYDDQKKSQSSKDGGQNIIPDLGSSITKVSQVISLDGGDKSKDKDGAGASDSRSKTRQKQKSKDKSESESSSESDSQEVNISTKKVKSGIIDLDSNSKRTRNHRKKTKTKSKSRSKSKKDEDDDDDEDSSDSDSFESSSSSRSKSRKSKVKSKSKKGGGMDSGFRRHERIHKEIFGGGSTSGEDDDDDNDSDGDDDDDGGGKSSSKKSSSGSGSGWKSSSFKSPFKSLKVKVPIESSESKEEDSDEDDSDEDEDDDDDDPVAALGLRGSNKGRTRGKSRGGARISQDAGQKSKHEVINSQTQELIPLSRDLPPAQRQKNVQIDRKESSQYQRQNFKMFDGKNGNGLKKPKQPQMNFKFPTFPPMPPFPKFIEEISGPVLGYT